MKHKSRLSPNDNGEERTFCVTAKNRLSGMRDVVTMPLTRQEAETIVSAMIKIKRNRAYIYPRVDKLSYQLLEQLLWKKR